MTGTISLLAYSAIILTLLASAGFCSLHAQRKKNKATHRK